MRFIQTILIKFAFSTTLKKKKIPHKQRKEQGRGNNIQNDTHSPTESVPTPKTLKTCVHMYMYIQARQS